MNEYQKDVVNLIPKLKSYALFLTKDSEKANDLVQDTLLKAIRKKHLFEKGSNLKAWLKKIMKNSFIDYTKSPLKRNEGVTDYGFESVQEKTHNIAIEKINIELINSIIAKIPITNKKCFDMYLNGFKYKEIAEHFDIPIGTVQARIFNARAFIKNELTKLDF